MSDSKTRSKFVAGLRKLHQFYWPPKKQILIISRYKKDGFRTYFWKCEKCGKECTSKDIKVDHITPVGVQPDLLPGRIGEYADRLFVSIDDYQLLCHECHLEKTIIDNKETRKKRKEIEFNLSKKEVKTVVARKKNARPKKLRRDGKRTKRGAKTST
jgi:translation initiation factor 2 beta subunit (eIF-2beta)/eIF-5